MDVTCFNCGERGHISTYCSKPKKEKGTHQVKRLELCEVVEPKGEMVHQCETFPITFDSEAECSLIKQKLSDKLVGKRINNVVLLKGIGNGSIVTHCKYLAT